MAKHLLLIGIWSFVSTLLPLPISPIVIYFYANLTSYNIYITILVASLVDAFTGILVYYIFLKFNYTKFYKYVDMLGKFGYRGEYLGIYLNTKLYDILNDKKTYQMPPKRLWNFLLFAFKIENQGNILTKNQKTLLNKAHNLELELEDYRNLFDTLKSAIND